MTLTKDPVLVKGEVPSWENPDFTPGKHCTSCRFKELPQVKDKEFPYTCPNCLPKIRAWKKRSDSAKKAAIKREITRKNKKLVERN